MDNRNVVNLIREIWDHLKERIDFYLQTNHRDHELSKANLKGFRSLTLFPGEYGERDILMLYKLHDKGNHAVFYKIGNHDYVYSREH